MPISPPDRLSFRLLSDGITDPFRHFSVEEAVLHGVDGGLSPATLRLRRSLPSVWIGIYQVPEEDVDLDYCRRNGIPVVRRYNPGGAVYQDQGSFCFSLFFRHQVLFERLGIVDPVELYPLFACVVADTCAEYGVEAVHSPMNDSTIGGRKVYGSAQVEWDQAFVHSGTFLVSTDCTVMDRVLRPSRLKYADKGFGSVRDRVITLSEAVGRPIPVHEVAGRLARHIAQHLQIELVPGELSAKELSRADELYAAKYSRSEWTFGLQPAHSSVLSTKTLSGVLTLAVDLDGCILRKVDVRGDFLVPRPAVLQTLLVSMRGQTLEAARALVQRSLLPPEVRDALTRLLSGLEDPER